MDVELTIEELKDRMVVQFDPDVLLELLQINAMDILERFEDRIEEYYDIIMGELG